MFTDSSFALNVQGLQRSIELLSEQGASNNLPVNLPQTLPESGMGEAAVLEQLATDVLGRAAYLDAPFAVAHMDPPTPWITWALGLWNARLNQNLLHPATAPFARDAESRVIDWLAPFFGMNGGHMTSGSSVANLTALWAARDLKGVKRVIASQASHLSVRKAAKILGLDYVEVGVDAHQRMDPSLLPGDMSDACLVFTVGTTNVGAIDPMGCFGLTGWTHIDAAWAGPLKLSHQYRARLAGIEQANSVSVSAHKWLFQPKESALVMFRDTTAAHSAISFGGAYLAAPNIGVQGSHGAAAIPLLATILAWGREGLVARIERCMANAQQLGEYIEMRSSFELFPDGGTGVVVFRPTGQGTDELHAKLPPGLASITRIDGQTWLRCVFANPNADMAQIFAILDATDPYLQ
jgi:glutamate/tyrosine decarboxylase-like PLP-dependent enzyme